MLTEAAYLTPADINEVTNELACQFMDWDELNETWDVHVPPKSTVTAGLPEGIDFIDVSLEIHELTKQNGLTYSTVEIGDGKFTVNGLCLE